MAKARTQFVCQACGNVTSRWMGKCEACDQWNTIVEETVDTVPLGQGKRLDAQKKIGRKVEFHRLQGTGKQAKRLQTGLSEFDRVTGGGLVDGSATLIGGDPGIGKSTLLLQVTAALAQKVRVAYISGEEAIDQVRLRAQRLGVGATAVELASATNVRDIIATIDVQGGPKIVVIDSIQTMYLDILESAPGSVGQVRSSAMELIRVAKRREIALLLVGHVTKEGAIAGPRVLEHMVDSVLYFEGERGHQFRILRGVKNRYGATDEIGVFDMTDQGLMEVPNPSALFLSDRQDDVAGATVFAGIEGTRPVLVEIQALVAPSALATPRRAVVGWETSRLAMVLAVLEARAGFAIAGHDVYLNVAGGLRINEPAADLAVATALVSSLSGIPIQANMVVFGEIGLSGEIRAVSQMDARLKEASKLGFTAALGPERAGKKNLQPDTLRFMAMRDLMGLDKLFKNGKTHK